MYHNFESGRDGKCCIVYKGVDVICLIRSSPAVIFHLLKESGSFLGAEETLSFTIELRGNVYMDVVYTVQIDYQLSIPKESFLRNEDEIRTELDSLTSAYSIPHIPIVVPLHIRE